MTPAARVDAWFEEWPDWLRRAYYSDVLVHETVLRCASLPDYGEREARMRLIEALLNDRQGRLAGEVERRRAGLGEF